MSFDLHVSVLREVRVEQEFESTCAVLTDLMRLPNAPQLSWEYPSRPKVRSALRDRLCDRTGFNVMLAELGRESLVQFGVADLKRYGIDEPMVASFSCYDQPGQNVIALGMAIALARLVGAKVEDGSGHWFTTDARDPAELLAAFRIDRSQKDLRSAISAVDAKLKRGRITRQPTR